VKKPDGNEFSLAHFTLILLLHYLVNAEVVFYGCLQQ